MISSSRPGLRLSIIIAAWGGVSSLERCLCSLKGDGEAADTEVIVVTNFDGGIRDLLEGRFPYVQHLNLAANTTVPILRRAGVYSSSGEIVALAEDHCTFGDGWCSEIKRAHELPYSVIGGSVENASIDSPLDWAVYFCDYGRFMLPNRASVVTSLPGNNVSYKRPVLEEVQASFRQGFFETFVHAEIQKQGHSLYLAPALVVYHQRAYATRGAVTQFYHLARGFAGKRILRAAIVKRTLFVLGTLALPVLLPARVVVRTIRKGRHREALLRSLPYVVLLMASWSLGEFCGYLAGEGGSAGRWK